MLALQKPHSKFNNNSQISFRGSSYSSGLGVVRDLFPIDFEVVPIAFKEEELLHYFKGKPVVQSLLYKIALIKLFLAKIIKVIKEYEKKYGRHPSVRH